MKKFSAYLCEATVIDNERQTTFKAQTKRSRKKQTNESQTPHHFNNHGVCVDCGHYRYNVKTFYKDGSHQEASYKSWHKADDNAWATTGKSNKIINKTEIWDRHNGLMIHSYLEPRYEELDEKRHKRMKTSTTMGKWLGYANARLDPNEIHEAIFDSGRYDWRTHKGPSLNLHFRGKPFDLHNGDVYGVRNATSKKQVSRLIIPKLGKTRVVSLANDLRQYMDKHHNKSENPLQEITIVNPKTNNAASAKDLKDVRNIEKILKNKWQRGIIQALLGKNLRAKRIKEDYPVELDPAKRELATPELTRLYRSQTPGQTEDHKVGDEVGYKKFPRSRYQVAEIDPAKKLLLKNKKSGKQAWANSDEISESSGSNLSAMGRRKPLWKKVLRAYMNIGRFGRR